MLSLVELRRAARVLEERISGHRVQEVVQPGPRSVVLATYGHPAAEGDSGRPRYLLLSARPEAARVSLVGRLPKALPSPPAFTQYLRAHVLGARVGSVRLWGEDRLLAVRLRARESDYDLLLALFGKRSNVLLLDGRGRIAAALRPLEETRPELALGEPWRAPESRPPTAGEDRFADESDESFLQAIEEHYARTEREGDCDALRRRVKRALRKEAKSLARKLAKLDRELAEAQEDAALERQGELLKGVLSTLRRGQRAAVARDFETGEEVVIPLDPELSPAQNLERLFRRYRKAVRGLAKSGAQREASAAAHAELEALASQFEEHSEAGDLEALEAFAARSEVRRLLEKYAPLPAARRTGRGAETRLGKRILPGRLVPRRYRTAGQLEVWVGRSDEGNDFLTTQLARGKDLFFHLDGAPGSHVILRTEGRADPPPDALLDACELAAHFSKHRNATRADVHVVPIKNVRKPKGPKPGLVTVHGGKTIHLRREPARLQHVLAARIED